MILIQLTGLSGAGKTTISNAVKEKLQLQGLNVEILDGDLIRKTKHKDLGFSKSDRHENIRRLGLMGYALTLENKKRKRNSPRHLHRSHQILPKWKWQNLLLLKL